jgi:hypothetical protein
MERMTDGGLIKAHSVDELCAMIAAAAIGRAAE